MYFDNTTLGTTTNEKGEFSITYTDAVTSTLVVSYLGYQKEFITNCRKKKNVIIPLKPSAVNLDEVVLDFDDGLTRKEKLYLFRTQFLGTSNFARSCRILNENDLVLRFNRANNTLYASADAPLKVKNRALLYDISFDIIDFEASFRSSNLDVQSFVLQKVSYLGTSFFNDLNKNNKRRVIKNRERAYNGSVQHFMRALYNENLGAKGYSIFHKSLKVNEWDYFKVNLSEDGNSKEVVLNEKVAILYNKRSRSDMLLEGIDKFYIDAYGNYSPIIGVFFYGALGDQRVGDTLPSDYGLD